MLNGTVQNASALGIQREKTVEVLEVVGKPQGRGLNKHGPQRIKKKIPRH